MKRIPFQRRFSSARAVVYVCISFIILIVGVCCGTRTSTVKRTDMKALPSVLTSSAPGPIDPQRCQDQQDMTWDDYHPIPGANWFDPSLVPARSLRIALVAVDFPDQPFVITLPKASDPFGNPQIDPVPRAMVPQFYADFYNKPQAFNHGHTVHEYWMEQSRGRVGIPKIDAYGPYRMPKNLFQYGLNEWNQQVGCPGGFKCDGRIEQDADALWIADAGKDIRSKYDIVLRIYAGYDETGVWQEFGEMKFQTRDDIPAEWGNPDVTKPRWIITRYAPWTSWKAGQTQWGQSTVRQGENSGTITHEIVHFAFRTGDNNNNPYVKPYRRVGCAPWDIVDRGSFNGPGGPHSRWVVPATQGASMPAGFMLRNRINFGFVRPENVLKLNRNGLANSGPVVATITARAIDPGPDGLAGITVALDGDAPQDRTPPCEMDKDPLCAGAPVFNFYSVEVVQRIGYDSFTPDNGVLIAKNKNREDNSCGYNCFIWVIDAHPEDMNMIDFKRPDGKPVMRSIADYRQLNDALFHPGTDSGSQYEWEDTANRLHFYVIDIHRDANRILSYTVGVRSLDGSGPHARGVSLVPPAAQTMSGLYSDCSFTLKNTGEPSPTDPSLHPQGTANYLNNDIYRLSVTIDGKGWSVRLRNELAAVKFGNSITLPVIVMRNPASAPKATVTLKAISESNPVRSSTGTCTFTALQ